MTSSIRSSMEKIQYGLQRKKSVHIDDYIVDFEIKGSLRTRDGEILLLTAEVRCGKWGKQYISVFPDLNNVISRGESFLRLDSTCFLNIGFESDAQRRFQQLGTAQKILLKEGGIIVHAPDHKIMADCKAHLHTFDESAIVLKALGFPKGYRFLLRTKNPAKLAALHKAGFGTAQHERHPPPTL